MKTCTVLFALFAAATLAAQKGATGVQPVTTPAATGVTRAVVIGISDYQDDGIQDLQFADRDAIAFKQWLQSPAGGHVPEDNIRLLLNKEATQGNMVAAFGWLAEHTQPNDRVIIYFSGHGDVDARWVGNLGYLLTWDTPAQMYMSGAFSLIHLQSVVSTLSQQNKAKVILITDACRSGKLAGGSPGGAQYTNANLAQQFTAEIKILSCQADEFSIEGVEWGGGRGVFSYHLVEGLYGLADRESDGAVSLADVDRYLEDHVSKEVAPMEQTPMIVGNRKELLATVFPELLDALKRSKEGQLAQMQPVEQKGLEDETLAKVDSSTREIYFAFKQAVEDKVFLDPADSCADAYYEKLMAVAELKPLYGAMTRNFAAAMQDDAQQWLNGFLSSTTYGGQWNHPRGYGRHLARAAELLGEGHYLYNNLKGKEYFFMARDVLLENRLADSASLMQFQSLLRQGLVYDDKAPYLYFLLTYGLDFYNNKQDQLEIIELLKKTVELAPAWIRANWTLSWLYFEMGLKTESLEWLNKAIVLDVDGKDPYLIETLIWVIDYSNYSQFRPYILKRYQLHSKDINPGEGLSLVSCFNLGYRKALSAGLAYHENDVVNESSHACSLYRLYCITHHFIESRKTGKEHVDVITRRGTDKNPSRDAHGYWYYGAPELAISILNAYILRVEASDDDNAKSALKSTFGPYAQMVVYNLAQGNLTEAEYWFEKQDRKDAFQNHGLYDGWGYGPATWLAYARGDFKMVDSLIESYTDRLWVQDLIEDMLLLVSITGQADYPIYILEKTAVHFPLAIGLHYHLGRLYIDQKNDYEKGLPLLEHAVQLDSTNGFAHYHLAAAYAHLGRNAAALAYLKKALENGYEDFEELAGDGRWEGLRGTAGFEALRKQYFPETGKD